MQIDNIQSYVPMSGLCFRKASWHLQVNLSASPTMKGIKNRMDNMFSCLILHL